MGFPFQEALRAVQKNGSGTKATHFPMGPAWVSQPSRPWIRVLLKPHLAEVMPWVLFQDSFKTIVRPQIHGAGFQHRQFKHEHIRQENARRIWSEIAGHDSLIYRFASSFTACDCHHTGLAESFWSLLVQVVLAAVQQNGLALEKVRWRFFFVDM